MRCDRRRSLSARYITHGCVDAPIQRVVVVRYREPRLFLGPVRHKVLRWRQHFTVVPVRSVRLGPNPFCGACVPRVCGIATTATQSWAAGMRSTRLKQLSARGINTKGYPQRVLKCPFTSSLYGMYGYPLQTNSTEDERNASCSILITLVPPESMDERNLRSTFPRTLPMNVYSCTAPHRTARRRLQLLSARDCPERSRRAFWAVLPSAACAGCRQDPLVFQALRHCCQGYA